MDDSKKDKVSTFKDVLNDPFPKSGYSPAKEMVEAEDAPKELAEELKSKPMVNKEAPKQTEEEAKDVDTTGELDESEGEEKGKAEDKADPKAEKPEPYVPLEAMLAERRKYKEALKAKDAEIKNTVDYHDDPENWSKTEIKNEITRIKQDFRAQITDMSEVVAQQMYPDYQDAFTEFKKVAQTNPAALQYVLEESPFPALEAYRIGKNELAKAKYGATPDEMEKRIRAEVEKEVREKQQKAQAEKLQMRNKQPTSLSGARAAGGDAEPDFKPTTFGDMLGAKR